MTGNVVSWEHEVDQLHEFFEAYFLGSVDSLERVDAVLAEDFTIVGPNGIESNRAETMAALQAGHGHTDSLEISTTGHQLKFETADLIVASYVENHQLRDRSNHRLTTVVFSRHAAAPNGLLWRRAHETWLESAAE